MEYYRGMQIIDSVLFIVNSNALYITVNMLSDLTVRLPRSLDLTRILLSRGTTHPLHTYVCTTILIPLHMQGIYPTITIVLVCLKLAYADQISRAETLARQTVEGPRPCSGNYASSTQRGVTSIAGAMSTEELDTTSHGDDSTAYKLAHVELGGGEPRSVAWPRLGQNGLTRGNMRLRYDPTYSGVGVDSVLAAHEERSLDELEGECKALGPEDGIVHAV